MGQIRWHTRKSGWTGKTKTEEWHYIWSIFLQDLLPQWTLADKTQQPSGRKHKCQDATSILLDRVTRSQSRHANIDMDGSQSSHGSIARDKYFQSRVATRLPGVYSNRLTCVSQTRVVSSVNTPLVYNGSLLPLPTVACHYISFISPALSPHVESSP